MLGCVSDRRSNPPYRAEHASGAALGVPAPKDPLTGACGNSENDVYEASDSTTPRYAPFFSVSEVVLTSSDNIRKTS